MSRVRFATAFTALLIASPILAQSSSPPSEGEAILVEGQRLDPSTVVRNTINLAGIMPLARFEDKICPGVVGLPAEEATQLVDLIRKNVVELGGKVQAAGCTANATVIFTDQPVDFIKKLAVKEPGYFEFSPSQLEQFTAAPRPVASWHVTETRDRDGNELGSADRISDKKRKLFNQHASATEPMDARVLRNSAASRLQTNSREDMLFAFAVLDAKKTRGKTMRQLADFATLHLLLDIKQDAAVSNPGSILSLFHERPEGAAAPAGFTAVDRAMVEGLYTPNENNRTAAQQFSQIASAVRKSSGKTKD